MRKIKKTINYRYVDELENILYGRPYNLVLDTEMYKEMFRFIDTHNRVPKIFISGAISSRLDTYKEVFDLADAELKKMNLETYNPAYIPKDTSWEDAMRETLNNLKKCDIMLVLKGWEESAGVAAEIEMAEKLNIPVFFEVYYG